MHWFSARQRIVSPFAGDGVGTDQHLAINDNAAAHAGAEDHTEHHLRPRRRAIGRFRKRKTVGIVGQSDRSAECGFEISAQRLADQPGRVGILDKSGGE